jgi:hypothetical protein
MSGAGEIDWKNLNYDVKYDRNIEFFMTLALV